MWAVNYADDPGFFYPVRDDSCCIFDGLCGLQVQLHGGVLQQQITAGTTHVMLLDPNMDAQSIKPDELLATASDKLGGAIAMQHLKTGLANGQIKLVSQR